MRSISVELSFDSASEGRLCAIWATLEREYTRCNGSELGVRPHVSLAVFREVEPRQLEQLTSTLATKLRPFVLHFAQVDAFRSSEGVVFVAPKASTELVDAHATLMSLLGTDKSVVHPYYRDEAWIPHCTIAVGVPADAIDHVAAAARDSNVLGVATVCRLSVVQYRPALELHGWGIEGVRRRNESI